MWLVTESPFLLGIRVLLLDETEPHSLCSSVICKNSQRRGSLTSSLHKYLVAESSGELSNHEDLATLTEDSATSTSQDARQRPLALSGWTGFIHSPLPPRRFRSLVNLTAWEEDLVKNGAPLRRAAEVPGGKVPPPLGRPPEVTVFGGVSNTPESLARFKNSIVPLIPTAR